MLEKEIENLILKYLNMRGIGFFWKNQSVGIYDPVKRRFRKSNSPYHINGVSDILGVSNSGRFIAIEVKAAKGKVSESQKVFLEKINQLGGLAFVARSIEDVQKYEAEFGACEKI